ncbi:MAG: chromate transporter [Treponema sp.]|jgi:chromate transporter|nr:chromate transporter [Treponema sp.]
MNLLILFGQFFKIGLFSIGGGYATLPFLYELADTSGQFSREDVGNMLAVAQSLPGAVGANLSAYAGFCFAGIPGALVAVLGLISPSIAIIVLVARLLLVFKTNTTVTTLFAGFRPAGAGLLSAAAFAAMAVSLYNPDWLHWYQALRWRELALFGALFFLVLRFKKHPVFYIAAAALAGVLLGL